MGHPAENRNTGVDDTLDVPLVPTVPTQTRNRVPSRCYNVAMIVVYVVLLIMTVVALGSFGKKQADIIQHEYERVGYYTDNTCILFAEVKTSDTDNKPHLYLHSAGLCGYVLWGLVSVTIVIFIWIVYSIVLAAIGPKV